MIFPKKFLLAALLGLCLLASACGGSGSSYDTKAASSSAAATAPMMVAPGDGEDYALAQQEAEGSAPVQGSPVRPENRKIIRHVDMNLESESFDEALNNIRQLVADTGGYIERESVQGRSLRDEYYEEDRSANILARIPSDKLDGAISGLAGFCNVLSQSENSEDVTERYFDAQAHLKTLEVQEERLLAILEKSEKLEDVIKLEQALSEVRYEIETITASLKHMDTQVAYSYLQLNLNEVKTYTEVTPVPVTFGQQLSDAFATSGRRVTNFLKGFLLDLIISGPEFVLILLVWALFLFVIAMIIRFILRRVGIRNRFTRTKKERLAQQQEPIVSTPIEQPSQEPDTTSSEPPENPESGWTPKP